MYNNNNNKSSVSSLTGTASVSLFGAQKRTDIECSPSKRTGPKQIQEKQRCKRKRGMLSLIHYFLPAGHGHLLG